MATQDNYIKTAFRLPPELHRDLVTAAEVKGRSLNAEIISRLQVDDAPAGTLTALTYRIASLEVELQSKRLDIIELAMMLRSVLNLEILDDAGQDPYLAEMLRKCRTLADHFSASSTELDDFGKEQTQKYEALKVAASAMHEPRTERRLPPQFADQADDMTIEPIEPIKRRINLKRKKA